MKPFKTLKLSADMLKNLNDLNFINMTSIQEMSIPYILDGRDLLAQAKTGSGKTAAFGIGLLEKLNVQKFRVQFLILCPTRELAEQVSGEIRRLARFKHNIKLLNLTGGLPLYKQEHSLSHEAHIVVGTPGRITKLLERGSLILEDLVSIVLDEADRMLDMGFIDQIHEIIQYTPGSVQTLCYSATFSDSVKKLAQEILRDPIEVVTETHHNSNTIKQHFFSCSKSEKEENLGDLIKSHSFDSIIIFCNTKDTCRRVASSLNKKGLKCLSLHGDLEQKDRTEVIVKFSNGSCRILVATDVAARGLDIKNLSAVINYELPFETETYIHRIGRTGRAGDDGLAYSFLVPGEEFRLSDINQNQNSELQTVNYTINDNTTLFSEPDMVTISINGGRKNKISAGDVLGALTSNQAIPGTDIGKIDRMDYLTFIAVKRSYAEKAYKILSEGLIKGREFKVIIHK